jgi:hypothetical protein
MVYILERVKRRYPANFKVVYKEGPDIKIRAMVE